jgi:hypothetical protein
MNFIQTVEQLSARMGEAAAHVAAHLKTTPTSHQAYGVLHRFERSLYDCSKAIDGILVQMTPEMRAKLAEDEDSHD